MVLRSSIKSMLFLLLLLASCTPSINHPDATIATAIDASPTPIHEGTKKTSEETLESGVPATSTALSTKQPLDTFTLTCQGISSSPIDHLGVSGELLATDENGFFILDLRNGNKTRVLQAASIAVKHNVYISPDGSFIAYTSYQNATRTILLVVEPVRNLLLNDASKRIEWGKGISFQLEGWFTNQTLVITRKNKPNSFFSTMIVNPFNGEEKVYSLEDLPNFKYFKSGGVGLYHFASSNLMPDPSLKRVVYPEWLNGKDYISLWDLETRKTLARIEDKYAFTGNPLWEQDGSNFLMVAATTHTETKTIFDWFQMSREGATRQLTHFGDIIENNFISNASRSNDGRYLAFKMKINRATDEMFRYYVLDLQTDQLLVFCVDAMDTPSSITEKQPIWSPDSRYVVISNTDESDNGQLILVNLAERKAYEISKDANVKGWMVKP